MRSIADYGSPVNSEPVHHVQGPPGFVRDLQINLSQQALENTTRQNATESPVDASFEIYVANLTTGRVRRVWSSLGYREALLYCLSWESKETGSRAFIKPPQEFVESLAAA